MAVPVLQADTAVRLAGPPATTAVPPDGRLRADGLAAMVEGVATGPATTTQRAAAGQVLWVVGLAVKTGPPSSGGTAPTVTATVTAGASRAVLPVPSATTGTVWYAASLPAGAADTVLTLTASSSSSAAFSLTHMAREGTTPAVAYRSTAGPTVIVPAPAPVQLPETWTENDGTAEGTSPVNLPVIVDTATLSYWAPDTPGHTAPTPNQAFLTVTLQSNDAKDTDGGFGPLTIVSAVPATALTLAVLGQPPVAAQLKPGGGGDNENTIVEGDQPSAGQAYGAFPDTYYFPVPADLTSATLTVSPPALQAFVNSGAEGAITPSPAGATAQLTLTPPAPVAWQPPAGATTTPARLTTDKSTSGTGARTPPTSSSGPHHTTEIVLLVVAAALLAGAAAIALARRRRTPALAAHPPAMAGPPGNEPASPWPTPPPQPVTQPPAPTGGWPAPAPPGPAASDDRPVDTLEPARADQRLDDPPVRPLPEPTSPPQPVSSDPSAPEADDAIPDEPGPAADPEPEPAPASPVRGPDLPVPPAPLDLPEPAIWVLRPVPKLPLDLPPNLANLAELATHVAVMDAPVAPDKLQNRLSHRPGTELSANTLHSYISRLRSRLTPPARLINDGPGYQLTGVTTDLHTLKAATDHTRRHPDDPRLEQLAGALALVAGTPLADTNYGWATEAQRVDVIDLTEPIREAALTLAEATHQPDLARWACHQAVLAVTERSLLAASLTAAAAMDRPGALDDEWDWVQARLTAARLDPDPTLEAHYRRLRGEPNP